VIAEKSASEELLCELKALFGVCDPVRLKTEDYGRQTEKLCK
jgi:hypothetical protein